MNQHMPASDGELIDMIYAAMLGESSWQAFLDRLSDSAPGGRTILFSHNMSQSDEYLAMVSRLDEAALESYASHYVNVNPWLQSCALRQVGLGIHSAEIMPEDKLRETEFFNDWLKPNDIGQSIGVTIDKSGLCPLIISTVTSSADLELGSAFSEQLTRIAPHLKRASRFYRKGPARWSGFEIGASLFDAVDIGLIIVGEDRRIRTISQSGSAMLEADAPISISPIGQLRLQSEDGQTCLSAMLRRTYAGEKTASLMSGDFKLTLVRPAMDQISLYFEGPTVVILIEKAAASPGTSGVELFAERHALTPAEQRALKGLMEGRTIAEIAAGAGLSRETIRSQVKSLFVKTGTHSQTELLRSALAGLKG